MKVINFIKSLIFIFMPGYWIMNQKFDKDWDKKLNELLDNNDFTDFEYGTARLGDYIIWVENYPYACFTPVAYKNIFYGYSCEFRASRLTIFRANKKLGNRRIPKYNSSFKHYKNEY